MTILGKPLPGWPPVFYQGLDIDPCLDGLNSGDWQKVPLWKVGRAVSVDYSHAPIADPYRTAVWNKLTSNQPLKVDLTAVTGGMLFADRIPAGLVGYLLVNKLSAASGQTVAYTRLDYISSTVKAGVEKAWSDPITPVLNIIPYAGSGIVQGVIAGTIQAWPVIDKAITVLGWSYSTAPYQVHALVIACAMRGKVRDQLKADGKLVSVITDIMWQSVAEVTGRSKFGQLWPRIEDLTGDDHIRIATVSSRKANAYGSSPVWGWLSTWF